MVTTATSERASTGLSAEVIRGQLDLMVHDQSFRSSKRSVQFLRYVVEQTLNGSADKIKERSIGIDVFGRAPSYDTSEDHVVRTAAIELRKRLAIYYGEEVHRSEVRMSLVPGSYVPHFSLPATSPEAAPMPAEPPAVSSAATVEAGSVPSEAAASVQALPAKAFAGTRWAFTVAASVLVLLLSAGAFAFHSFSKVDPRDLFWEPILDTPGSVLLAIGDVPNGPPTLSGPADSREESLPIVQKASASTVPFADAVTIARVLGMLQAHGKTVSIHSSSTSSFPDLREGPVVLIGAFNNEWSLRLTRSLRYTLALDPAAHLIYIRDAQRPESRDWNWKTDGLAEHQGEAGSTPLRDYALISRMWNSETGHAVIVIGGLYTHGTEAAGEFLADPQMLETVARSFPLRGSHRNLQIVLGTTVTDGTPGPPRVLAVSEE